ncbi:hypothetical protein [Ancylobacter terrae]|uniref:hypothetical protein n=1 Tax=Ancylobacter sp. sgz301288 TaxID=3342077 RepID=UPI00385F435F
MKPVVRIPFINVRDGRPRYVATPSHRALGFRGEDLRHADGTWFTLAEALAFAVKRAAEVEERRKAKAEGRKLLPPRKPDTYTVGDLIRDWQHPEKNPRFGTAEIVKGKRRIRPLAAASRRFFGSMSRTLEGFDEGRVWAAPAAQLNRRAALGIYHRLLEEKGPAMARGVMAALSSAWAFGHGAGRVGASPFSKLEMEQPPPRLRIGSVDEMRALIAAADLLGRPEIGDAVVMGLLTGQRQSDRLLLVDGRDLDGRLLFRQKKTGAVVLVPPSPALMARLKAARERRKAHRVQHPEIIIDEKSGRPFGQSWYAILYRTVRAAAVAGIMDEEATATLRAAARKARRNEPEPTVWKLEPCPSLADFRDQDLRDTAVTWMALAGATIPEIISVTGHSEASATQILKHYLGRHPEMAASAVGKAAAWLEGKGGL